MATIQIRELEQLENQLKDSFDLILSIAIAPYFWIKLAKMVPLILVLLVRLGNRSMHVLSNLGF